MKRRAQLVTFSKSGLRLQRKSQIARALRLRMPSELKKARRGYLPWCQEWANSIEGRSHLLAFAYSEDEGIAFQATLAIIAYGFGKPRSNDGIEDKPLNIDWRHYEGEDGQKRLVEDMQKEWAKYQTETGQAHSSTHSPDSTGLSAP